MLRHNAEPCTRSTGCRQIRSVNHPHSYKQVFPWLHSSYPTAAETNIRNIIHSSHPDVAFIGFVRPGVGAIPPIAEQQAMWWTTLLLGRMRIPTSPPHYHLLASKGSRIQYGVDYSAYMSTLARDFGARLDLFNSTGATACAYCLCTASGPVLSRFTGLWDLLSPLMRRRLR